MRLKWTREEVNEKLKRIMKDIHQSCRDAADMVGTPGNFVNGANIAGFPKVADSMIDQEFVSFGRVPHRVFINTLSRTGPCNRLKTDSRDFSRWRDGMCLSGDS